VAQATQGIPYRYGGEDPRTGIDCSAFVRWVMGRAGIPLPRSPREQLRATVPVREYRPGYLLFFSESRREVDHVAIYIGRGYMLHASGKWGRVAVEPVIRYAPILVAIGAPQNPPRSKMREGRVRWGYEGDEVAHLDVFGCRHLASHRRDRCRGVG
jgi:cell wall-associated NlpC family hydrolase